MQGARASGPPIFLRNGLPRPVLVPLASGGSRYLSGSDTTLINLSDMAIPGLREAVEAGIVVRVCLPAPGTRSVHLVPGMNVRSPISSAARQILAERLDMGEQVAARMKAERAAGEAMIYGSQRWTRQEWRADRAWHKAAQYRAKRARLTLEGNARARNAYKLLRKTATDARVPPAVLAAVLDGEAQVGGLNGHAVAVLARSETEISTVNPLLEAALRYNRRARQAQRLLRAAQEAKGLGPAAAARWLVARIEAPQEPLPEVRTRKKLTADDAREIRRLVGMGHLYREVAPRFGVSTETISKIMTRHTWADA